MNPYYQQRYPYANNNAPNLPYQINSYPVQKMQPVTNIESLYSNLQPYSTKQFLLTTFGYKPEYIQIFLTLSHEDKLKLYLIMQQKKFYGSIQDQTSYQRILKMIADKMKQNNWIRPKDAKIQKKEESNIKKEKDLENKINQICEKTFEKLKITTFQKDVSKWEEDFGQFEESGQDESKWTQQTQINEVQAQHQSSPKLEIKNEPQKKQEYIGLLNNQNANIQPLVPAMNGPVFNLNMFTFDPDMERALTKQIGLKKLNSQQKVDIWSLELEQSELKKNQPNIRQVFQKKQEVQSRSEMTFARKKSYDFGGSQNFKVYQFDNKTLINSLNFGLNNISQQFQTQNNQNHFFNLSMKNTKQEGPEHNKDNNLLSFEFNDITAEDKKNHDFMEAWTINSKQKNSKQQEIINYQTDLFTNGFNNVITAVNVNQVHDASQNQPKLEISTIKISDQKQKTKQCEVEQEQWADAEEGLGSSYIDKSHDIVSNFNNQQQLQAGYQLENVSQPTYFSNILSQQSNEITNNQNIQQNSPPKLVQSVKPNQNLFDFDAMETIIQKPVSLPYVSEEMSKLFILSTPATSTKPQQVHQQNQNIPESLPSPVIIIPIIASKSTQVDNIMNSQLFPVKAQDRYDFLDSLKIELNPKDLEYIEKQLKHKSFQCNWNFYSIIINYLKQISLEESPQYQHFVEQFKISKQIHDLTERYSQVVEEDEEEIVFATIRQSKQLYNQIYNKSSLTEQYVSNFFSSKTKQKGFLHSFGKILVDSSISKDIIERAINQQNRKNIQNSFYVIYTLQKLNSLKNLKSNTERIIKFLNEQYDKYKNFDQQLLQKLEKQAETQPKFIVYIKGTLRVCAICERMIQLVKSCCIKVQANVVKTLKICKDFKGKYLQYAQNEYNAMLLQDYTQNLKKGINKKFSLYELHTQFLQSVKKNPICCFCLLEVSRWGGQNTMQGCFHYSCYNFIKQLMPQQEY